MCGVGGVIHLQQSETVDRISLDNMLAKLRHRGPDSNGIKYINDQSVFLHTRLSIIDLSPHSAQPFVTQNSSYLSFNGEIYNYKELQSETLKDINSISDTEVLAEGLDSLGLNFLQHVDGMFAFAYYSSKEDSFVLARDQFGIKPLYYYQDESKVVFASEIKSILEYKGINKDIDFSSISEFFQLGYILDPDTGFKHIKQVRPGHYIKIRKGEVTEYPIKPNKLYTELTFIDNLKLSIKRRLVSDVPLTALYSGGIDSSIIAQELPNNISLTHLDLNSKNYSEKKKATINANKLKKELNIYKSTLNFDLQTVFYYADDLIADPAVISNFLLYQEVSKYYKVGLQGDGADELFRGYHTHTAQRISQLRFIKFVIPLLKIISKISVFFEASSRYPLSMKLTRFIKSYKLGAPLMYLSWRSPFLEDLLNIQFTSENTLKKFKNLFNQDRKKSLDIDFYTYLSSNILKKVDRMSMAFGYEVRVPFLASYVVKSSRLLSEKERATFLSPKKYIRSILRDKEIGMQAKDGFGFDLVKLINTRRYHSFLLEDNSVTFNKFICREKLKDLLSKKAYDYNTSYQIFTILAFKYWIHNNKLD